MNKFIHIYYFSILREESNQTKETVQTESGTPSKLYEELSEKYTFSLPENRLRVAINDVIQEWDTQLNDGDTVVFIPPVSGG